IPTRLTSSPRMIGRLEAPGAKLEPVMPGFENRRSPSVAPPDRRSSSFGTTVTVANWSVTTGSTPCCGDGAGGAGCACGAGPRLAPARATRVGVRTKAGFRFTIGLGAVTLTSGSAVGASSARAAADIASQLAPAARSICLFRILIVPVLMPSRRDGPIAICPSGDRPRMRGDPLTGVDQSSGNGRGAGLERRPRRAQMSELGVGDEEKQFDGVWQQQQRRRCEHHLVRHRQNRADRTRLARSRIVVVRWLLLRLAS